MNYRGFNIVKKYALDVRPPKKGEGIDWVYCRGEFEGYAIHDPMENDRPWDIYPTVSECKTEIDRVCDEVLMMKDNSLRSWQSLEGWIK